MSVRTRKPSIWLAALTGRMSMFFFLNTAILLGLFLIGNFQEFLDSTQELLLLLMQISSFLAGLCSLYYGITILFSMIYRKRSYLFRFLIATAGSLLGFLFSGGISLIIAWLAPMN